MKVYHPILTTKHIPIENIFNVWISFTELQHNTAFHLVHKQYQLFVCLKIGQKLLDSLAETWDFFFCDVLTMLQAIFHPVQVQSSHTAK